MIVNRRKLITGLVALVAAPAVVRATSLMPVKPMLFRVPGTDAWVSWCGSDSNEGTSASPWKTIQHALDVVSKEMDFRPATVTVNIAEGEYIGFAVPDIGPGAYVNISGAVRDQTIKTILTPMSTGVCIDVSELRHSVVELDKVTLT